MEKGFGGVLELLSAPQSCTELFQSRSHLFSALWGRFRTTQRSLWPSLRGFNAVERDLRRVWRQFRGLTEGFRALETPQSHSQEAWSATELLKFFFLSFFFFLNAF